MQFIKPNTNINFTGALKLSFSLSGILIIASILSLIMHHGPKYGVDFAGGSSLQVKFATTVKVDDIQKGLKELKIDDAVVQRFGQKSDNEYQIRSNKAFMNNPGFTETIIAKLKVTTKAAILGTSIDMVGPQVSQQLRTKALLAMFYSLLFITIYISGRFQHKWELSLVLAAIMGGMVYLVSNLESIPFINMNAGLPFFIIFALIVSLIFCWFLNLQYAMGAIIALIHDVTITVGIFSILGIEFTLPIVAALLTIIGYSLNDTIIVYDRIRENLKKHSSKPLDFIINRSINETLSRTILTSFTTLVVVIALYVLGGGVIHNFAFAMLIGIVAGTYSSIYVASPILLAWSNKN